MIKLNRPDKPSDLTPEVEKQLVKEYIKGIISSAVAFCKTLGLCVVAII